MVSFKFLLLLLVQLALAAKMCPPDLTDAEIFEAAMKQEGPEAALELLQVQRVKAGQFSRASQVFGRMPQSRDPRSQPASS